MKPIDFIPEKHPIVQAAESMHMDHEVQMAREECYHSASNAMELHRMLKKISEEDGIPGWASEKITLANDYLRNVKEWLEYELGSHMENKVADENMNTLGIVEEGDYPDGSSIKTPGANEWKQQYQQAVMAVKNAKTQQEYEAASNRAGRIKDLLASKGIQVGPVLGQQSVTEADMNRRGFLGRAGAAAAVAAAPGLAKAADQTDPNKLMASMLMGGEYKEFDLTPMIEKYNWGGAPKQVIIQADKWLSNFLRQRGNMYSNLKIKYKGITMNSSKIGDVDAPDAEFESTAGASSSGGMATNMGGQQAGELFGGRPKSRTSK